MFWSLRENLCGVTHVRRLVGRLVLRRSRLHYAESLKAQGFAVEPVLGDDGETLNCRGCGYTNIRFELSPGIVMTSCSTLGSQLLKHHKQLNLWSSQIPRSSQEAMERAKEKNPGQAVSGQTEGVVKGSPRG